MPPFREVVFVTTRPRRLGHLRKLLREVRVTSHVRVMDPWEWCGSPESWRERLVFLDAASAPPRDALIAARGGATGSRLVLCCRTPAPDAAQLAIECGLDGVLSANLAPEDAARALRQICLGERQFRFEAPMTRRAPASHASPAKRHPTISFSSQRIVPASVSEPLPAPVASRAPRSVPTVSFMAERIGLTAPAPRPAPRVASAVRPAFDIGARAPRSAPPTASRPDFDTLWMFGASES